MSMEEQMRDTFQKALKAWPIIVVTAVVLACSGEAVTDPESGLPCCGPELPTGGQGEQDDSTVQQSNDATLFGSWTRLLLFTDVAGVQRGSRLTYQFGSDSTFTRTLVTSNFSQGIEDTVVETGRWTTSSGTLLLRFNPGQLNETNTRFSYRIARRSDGNQILLLDDSGFVRD
jgi:hypothetical protein